MVRLRTFLSSRWLVFVCAMWVESSAGVGYLFGSMSPVIKRRLGYNQQQIEALAVAKDAGQFIGLFAACLCNILPSWAALLIGALKNFFGYGWVWLIVSGRLPALPLWGMCILIFVGTNGDTYFNTTSMVSCVQSFPENRGPVVGILKGFSVVGGAVLTQIYATMHTTDEATLIFMVAVGPPLLAISLMFIVRPVKENKQVLSFDNYSFTFINMWCLFLASYLLGIMLMQDLVNLSKDVINLFTAVLVFLLVVPIAIPLLFTLYFETGFPVQDCLLPAPHKASTSGPSTNHSEEAGLLSLSERQERIAELQRKSCATGSAEDLNVSRRGPRRGEDFTLMEALIKADFWILFMSLLLGTGSAMTVIDNLGQLSQSLGYEKPEIFVSMLSIWNFLGRIAGGYLSEIIVRNMDYPRPLALAVAQVVLASGHFFIAMGWPGTMYVAPFLIGMPYGAHWSIALATASELFGLKQFGALYNFLTASAPAGTLVFSGLITGKLYDYEAEKQGHISRIPTSMVRKLLHVGTLYAGEPLKCEGVVCFFLSSLIMVGVCMVAVTLSMILVYRTKTLYTNLYKRPRI